MRRFVSIFLFFVFFLFVLPVNANEDSFLTIVNPVRISTYTEDPVASLKAEYSQIELRNLPATWLLTFDVLENKNLMNVIDGMNNNQEFGLFLEVTPKYAKTSNVSYNATNSWHRSTSLFLSGYKIEDRMKLIDTAFKKFKEKFKVYPKSVGAWWVDSYSLSYMQDKYGITGVLGVSDQYDLDGYQVWGTPYSIPFYPNKLNAAVPANSLDNKIDVATFRWAPRDPLNGYLSPSKEQASLYSIQDYNKHGLTDQYFKELVAVYSQKNEFNKFGHATIGVEADYSPSTYEFGFSKQLDLAQELSATFTTMEDFSSWYRKTFKLSPNTFIISPDLLGKEKRSLWFNTNNYRIGLVIDEKSKKTSIVDLRAYPSNFAEPFLNVPNKQYGLSINLPFIIDSQINSKDEWILPSGKLNKVSSEGDSIVMNFENGEIVLRDDSIRIKGLDLPKTIEDSDLVSIEKSEGGLIVRFKNKYSTGENGVIFSSFSPRIPFAIKHRAERYQFFLIIFILVSLILAYVFARNKLKKKHLVVILVALSVGGFAYLGFQNNTKYYISQTELDGLSVLKRFSQGNVLVYDKDCLRCEFQTRYKPAAAAGFKSYVAKYSEHKITTDYNFQTAPSATSAKEVLVRKKINYIYLSKYEDYIEHLPYPPEDIGLKRVYENANVQIWKVL